ncbi:hypothetical protein SAMN04488065_0963 [Haloplanus vescus]|uniref:Uncharacterized protein n=1 Tax=Haloplanus vescus TaxID=555874 RepID=A0A1H3WNI1_9EURY|nr:hypothetical protein [Haloplanus vescus]SDZ87914.1 hypothetical protein SAMN04488065_0963 [Haloplanus vescus]
MSRGQTTIDFAIGTSVFLLVVAFVVAFIPGIFQPFTGGPQEELAGIDRVADTVVYDLLDGDGDGNRATLDRRCTIAFFDDDGTDTGCAFDDSEPLSEQVALTSGHHANVTVVAGDPDTAGGSQYPVCADGGQITVSDTDTCSSGVALDAGEPLPPNGASVIGRRVVSVDGITATVVVRMW